MKPEISYRYLVEPPQLDPRAESTSLSATEICFSIETPVAPSLTSVMGVAPVLPGEPADFYQRSLNALIKELGARSVLAGSTSPKRSTSACGGCDATKSKNGRPSLFRWPT